MKAKVTILSLKGKYDIWWEYLKNVRGIMEKEMSWRSFEEYFKENYLS